MENNHAAWYGKALKKEAARLIADRETATPTRFTQPFTPPVLQFFIVDGRTEQQKADDERAAMTPLFMIDEPAPAAEPVKKPAAPVTLKTVLSARSRMQASIEALKTAQMNIPTKRSPTRQQIRALANAEFTADAERSNYRNLRTRYLGQKE